MARLVPPFLTHTTINATQHDMTRKVDEMAAGDFGYGAFRLCNRVAQTALLGGVLALGKPG